MNVEDAKKMNVEDAIACIELAMRAAHNLNNVLITAQSWVREASEASEPGGHGHYITARHQVDEAKKHALRALDLCCEASTKLRLVLAYHGNGA